MGASLSQHIVDEIDAQRQLIQAEHRELKVQQQSIESLTFIRQLADDLQFLDVAKGKNIVVNKDSTNVSFESDPVLLRRVLNNMVKNALEASTAGETVTLAVTKTDQKLKFQSTTQSLSHAILRCRYLCAHSPPKDLNADWGHTA